MPRKSKPDVIALAGYLASLIAIVNYLDDTGQEYHAQRLIIAKEWKRVVDELNAALTEADDDDAHS